MQMEPMDNAAFARRLREQVRSRTGSDRAIKLPRDISVYGSDARVEIRLAPARFSRTCRKTAPPSKDGRWC